MYVDKLTRKNVKIMKKLFYFMIAVAVFASCNNSPEDKAEVLIKKELMKSLYKPDTYNPIETSVDSAFSPKDDPALFDKLQEVMSCVKKINRTNIKMKQAKSSMSLWSDAYQTSYSRNRYSEAKEDYDKAMNTIVNEAESVGKLYQEMDSMLNQKDVFIGWKATHNYRADNNAGNTLIGNSVYIIDKNFEKVLFSCEEDEYKEIQKAISGVKEYMEKER